MSTGLFFHVFKMKWAKNGIFNIVTHEVPYTIGV